MARYFQGTTTSKLELAEAIITARNFTFACWFIADDAATLNYTLISISDGSNANLFRLYRTSGVVLATQAVEASSAAGDTGATSIAADTWYHGAYVAISTDKDYVYLNGAKDSTGQAVLKVPTGLNKTIIGIRATTDQAWNGSIAEAAIWDTNLNDNELAALADGELPNAVRTGNLKCYLPMFPVPLTGSEVDLSGNQKSFTIGSTADEARPHPPVRPYARRKRSYFIPAAVAASTTPPKAMHHYKQRRA